MGVRAGALAGGADLWFKEQLTTIFPPAVDFSKPMEGVEEILDSTKIADLSMSKAA